MVEAFEIARVAKMLKLFGIARTPKISGLPGIV